MKHKIEFLPQQVCWIEGGSPPEPPTVAIYRKAERKQLTVIFVKNILKSSRPETILDQTGWSL